MNDTPNLPSDRQLVDAARTGHDAAWKELMERHEAAIRSVVPHRGRSGRRVVTQALEDFRESLDEQTPAEGELAIRAFRPRAVASITGGSYGPDFVDPSVARIDDDRQLLATAFARLPEPWQTVLWHSHVEQLTAAEVSPLVGRTVNEVTELLSTAERGLIDAYLVEYLQAGDFDAESSELIPLLSGFVRGALPPHEQRQVQGHLDDGSLGAIDPATGVRHHGADDSRRLIAVASALPQVMPAAIAPSVTGMSVDAHRNALGTATRSFGSEAMRADRSDRIRRAVVAGSAVAVVLALIAVAFLVRQPFDNDDDSVPTSGAPTTEPAAPTSTESAPTSEPAVDPTVPSTTQLDLRPPPTGPANEIEFVIDEDIAVGFAQPSVVSAAITSPAPILAGGTGTLDISLVNDGAAVFDGGIELVLPRGVVLDALVTGPARCEDPDGDSPRCAFAVDPGGTTDFSIRLRLESSVVGRLTVVGEALAVPFEAQIEATGDLVHNSVGRGDIAMIGNTLMTCAPAAAAELGISCDEVVAGSGPVVNRWDVPMEFVGAAPQFGLANSSSARLELNDGARVLHAELFWSGDLEEAGVSVATSTQDRVTFVGPDDVVTEVTATEIALGEEDATQYVGRADVTDLVAAAGSGDYLVGNLASVEVQGSYGAWSLVVVIDDDTAPRRFRVVTDPFDWVAPEPLFTYEVDMPVPVVAEGSAMLRVTGFEGELGFLPESLRVGDVAVGGDNPFDSTVGGPRDPAPVNNLGVDLDAYDLTIDSPSGTLRIEATSAEDGIRLAVLGLTVDLVE